MTITVTPMLQRRDSGIFAAADNLSQSTATAEQSVSLGSEITTLSGGTATGYDVDRYLLAAGSEGQHKTVVMLATGEAKMDVSAGTSTGSSDFTTANMMWVGRYINGLWRIVSTETGTTTATNSA